MSELISAMKLTSLAPWFGGKRTLAPEIVRQLGPHRYYFEGCCGSMSVLFAKEPSENEMVCDLHGGLINLALLIQNEARAGQLFSRLQHTIYCDEVYQRSKAHLEAMDEFDENELGNSLRWAYHYFIASWMGRSGVAGTAVNYQIATRWTKGGGSGPLRFRNAVDSIPAWCKRLRNVHIHRRDLFKVLEKIEDYTGVAIYLDPPYIPDTVSGNSRYLHDFDEGDHERLADVVNRFRKARVVVSYYDSPRLDVLYAGWTKLDHKHLHVQNRRGLGKGMTTAPEVLLINKEAIQEDSLPLFSAGPVRSKTCLQS